MKSFDIKPTEENLIIALNDDLLQRNKDLVYFYDLISSQESSCSIALDGLWGSGKTFFVKQEQMIINARNSISEMVEDKRKQILEKVYFNDDNPPEKQSLAVYYDAWLNDNDTDPILSIIYEIIKQISIKYSLTKGEVLINLAGSVVDFFTGHNIKDVLDALENDDSFSKFKEEKDIEEKTKDFFSELLNERGNRLVLFIDELDRCKPSFAVQLLERVKHYLEDERITIVFSVNTAELQHTIKHYYGEDFDASRYLDRFFDLRVALPPADTSKYFSRVGLDSYYVVEKVCRRFIDYYNLQLRDISRYYKAVRTAIFVPTHSKKWNFSFSDGKAKELILLYVVPFIIGLRMVDISEYHKFINGQSPNALINFYRDSELGRWAKESFLENDETYNEATGKKLVTIEEKLRRLYNAIFVDEYNGDYAEISIGKYEFNKESREFVLRTASMLSQFTDCTV